MTPMAPGGQWMRPPHDAPPVYVPAKQVEAHYKRLVGEKWTPIDDPRPNDGSHIEQKTEPAMTAREVSMQVQIDQLTALVQQLVAQNQKAESHGSTINDGPADRENAEPDRRPVRHKSAT